MKNRPSNNVQLQGRVNQSHLAYLKSLGARDTSSALRTALDKLIQMETDAGLLTLPFKEWLHTHAPEQYTAYLQRWPTTLRPLADNSPRPTPEQLANWTAPQQPTPMTFAPTPAAQPAADPQPATAADVFAQAAQPDEFDRLAAEAKAHNDALLEQMRSK